MPDVEAGFDLAEDDGRSFCFNEEKVSCGFIRLNFFASRERSEFFDAERQTEAEVDEDGE
jgi:hypothetical protein